VLLGGFALADAQADPYTFYQYANSSGTAPSKPEHFETPYLACRNSVGGSWQGFVSTVTQYNFDSSSQVCAYGTSDNQIVFPVLITGAGSCSADLRWDFSLQRCGDFVNKEQEYALSLATFLWLCLIGGFLVGFRAAQ
jgi:hypothetical protein